MKRFISLILAIACCFSLAVNAFAVAEEPEIVVSDVSAEREKGVTVTVSLKNNTGIAAMKLFFEYDTDVLTFEEGSIGSAFAGKGSTNVYDNDGIISLNWVSMPKANYKEKDVVFATLSFTVKSNADIGASAFSVSYDPDDVYDEKEENVKFGVTNGNVTVVCTSHTFTAETATADYKKSDATCTSAEVYYKSCKDCGLSSKGQEGEATFTSGNKTAHNFVKEAATVDYKKSDATCTELAVYYKSCDVCGASSKGDKNEATFTSGNLAKHKFTKEERGDKYLKSDATCDSPAVYYKSCEDCGHTSKGQEGEATFKFGNTLNHEYDEIVDSKYLASEATCTEQAKYYVSCTLCGASSKGTGAERTFASGNLKDHDFTAKNTKDEYIAGNATCGSAATYYYSCKVCGLSSENETGATFTSGEALKHLWGDTQYDWNSDYTECKATRYCERGNCGESEEIKATISSKTTAGNCVTKTKTVYTATFSKNWAETQTKEVEGDYVTEGHSWAEKIVYNWNSDYTKCTATRVCDNNGDHNIVIEGTVSKNEVKPTCEEDGSITYTAEFPKDSFATKQVKTVAGGAKLDHDWKVEYEWSEDKSACTATRHCERDNCDVTETAKAKVTTKVTKEANCVEVGEKTHTATFSGKAAKWAENQTTTSEIPVDPTKHDLEYTTTKEPTCTEGGLRDVDCKRNGCNYSKTDEPIEKLGHDFGAWVVVEKPTTTKEGLQRRDCKNCDHYETKKMPKIIIEDDDGVTEGITDIVPGDIAEESNPNTGAPVLGFVPVVIAACAAFIKKRQ